MGNGSCCCTQPHLELDTALGGSEVSGDAYLQMIKNRVDQSKPSESMLPPNPKSSQFKSKSPENLLTTPNPLTEQHTRGLDDNSQMDGFPDSKTITSILVYSELESKTDFPPHVSIIEKMSKLHKELFAKNGGFAFRLTEYPGKDNETRLLQDEGNQAYYGQCKLGQNSGEFEKEGRGYLAIKDTMLYAGYFYKDLFEGPGMLIAKDGRFFYGIWRNGKLNGIGYFKSTDGKTYQGGWVNSLQHGQGEEKWEATGSYYRGEFIQGERNGKGELRISEEGTTYKGDFRNNMLSGFGEFEWDDGKVYRGTWEKDLMHGRGIFIWPDGRSYDGDYFYGKKNGYGSFTWPDGNYYKGEWKKGLQNGKGVLIDSKGDKKEGVWKEGVIQP